MQDLLELANLWDQVSRDPLCSRSLVRNLILVSLLQTPNILSMGVLNAFFNHLDSETAPMESSRARGRFPASDRAFMALVGLGKAGNHLTDSDTHGPTIVQAWPGVFKWSAFFFAGRVQHQSVKLEVKKSNLDIISAAWYALSRSDSARKVMSATKGSIEIATQMWVMEDKGNLPSLVNIPTASAALDALLKDAQGPALDRVVGAAGGGADNVAQLMLSRLRTSINGTLAYDAPTVVYLDLIGHLSRKPEHALRHAFLSSNTIALCTKIAVTVSTMLNRGGGPPILLDVMVAAFGYLTNCLESTDGFTWVSQSIQAGLLTAFVDCSPHYSKLDPDDCDMVLTIVRDILPKYLVYRSVIQAVDGTIRKLDHESHRQLVEKSIAWDIWMKFHKLALERYMVTLQATAMKGKAATCDNVHVSLSPYPLPVSTCV